MDLLCTSDDVAVRLGSTPEPGSPELARVEAGCVYVSAVLRARFPLIPATVPEAVNAVATEVTVRYLGADPATGGLLSETIGAYSYRRTSGMGSTALTDDEYLVMAPYGRGRIVPVVKSNGVAAYPSPCIDDESWCMSRTAWLP
ncbi:MAG: hypothetical protein WCF04_11010 [Candidatus Nanopelagicales bacterium]